MLFVIQHSTFFGLWFLSEVFPSTKKHSIDWCCFIPQNFSHLPRKLFSTPSFQSLFDSLGYVVIFGRRKIPPTWSFWWRMCDCSCITSELGIFRMCNQFPYFLTCLFGSSRRWSCQSSPGKHSSEGLVCRSKRCAKTPDAYVFLWFFLHNFMTSS